MCEFLVIHKYSVIMIYAVPFEGGWEENDIINLFFYKCFDQMWLKEEARIAQFANINHFRDERATHRRKKACT